MGMEEWGRWGFFSPSFFPLPSLRPPSPSSPRFVYNATLGADRCESERVCERRRAVRGSEMGWVSTHSLHPPRISPLHSPLPLPITPSLSPSSIVIAIGPLLIPFHVISRVPYPIVPCFNPNHCPFPRLPLPLPSPAGHLRCAINRQSRDDSAPGSHAEFGAIELLNSRKFAKGMELSWPRTKEIIRVS